MWALRDLRNIELGLAAKMETRAMLIRQIENGCYRDDDLARAAASLVEYDECIAILENECKSMRQSPNGA
jgi:hypothetical protein